MVTLFAAFHVGLLVTAGLQLHETRVALVQRTGCDATVDAIVSFSDVITSQILKLWKSCDGAGTLWSRVFPFLIVSPCVIGASWLLLCYFTKELYAEFG